MGRSLHRWYKPQMKHGIYAKKKFSTKSQINQVLSVLLKLNVTEHNVNSQTHCFLALLFVVFSKFKEKENNG